MRIVVVADTHNQHREVNTAEGDVIIHCGAITLKGSKEESIDFLLWFEELNSRYIQLLVCGVCISENANRSSKTNISFFGACARIGRH